MNTFIVSNIVVPPSKNIFDFSCSPFKVLKAFQAFLSFSSGLFVLLRSNTVKTSKQYPEAIVLGPLLDQAEKKTYPLRKGETPTDYANSLEKKKINPPSSLFGGEENAIR